MPLIRAILCLLLLSTAAHAQKVISDYPAAASVARTDKLLLQQGAAPTPYTYGTPAQLFSSMLAADVTTALGYTPLNAAGGTISGNLTVGGSLTTSTVISDLSTSTATSTGSTAPRSLADRFGQVINVRDYGAKCDGTTDDSSAFSAAVAKVNSNFSSGKYTVIYIPAGSCLLNSAITQFALHVPGAVVGDGPLKSFVVVGTSYVGDLFSWSEAWGLTNLHTGTYPTTSAWNGPTVQGVSLVANTSAGSTQNALHFYDHNDFILIKNVDMWYFNGACLSMGADLKNSTVTYARESRFDTIRMWSCGSPLIPAMTISTAGATTSESSNELSFYNVDLIASNGKSLVINNANTGSPVRDIRFYGLRVESGTDDLVTIGDSVLGGSVANVAVYGLQENTVASGKSGLVFSAPALSSAPSGMFVQGNIGSGTGNGVTINAGTDIKLLLAINVTGTDLSVASSTTVAAPLYIDGNGSEYLWTTSVDSTVLPFLRLPPLRYGNPDGSASLVTNVHDGTAGRGNAPAVGSNDLQSKRFGATQTASGANSTIGGGENNTADGGDATVAGGNTNRASNLDAFVGGGNNNLASGTRSVVGGGNTNTADGAFSVIPGGGNATARGHNGAECMASSDFAAQGDAQRCTYILHGTTSNTSAVTLTADGAASGSSNCINIPTLTQYALVVDVTALDHTAVANNESWLGWNMKLHRPTNAASTTLVTASTPTALTSGTVTGSSVSATADTTNGCLNLSFTPPTGNADTWRAVATVRTVQVQ